MTHTSAGGKLALNACASATCTYLKFDNFDSSLMFDINFLSVALKNTKSVEEVTSHPQKKEIQLLVSNEVY